MSEVWKPPEVFSSLACRQPSVFIAFFMRASMFVLFVLVCFGLVRMFHILL